MHHFVIANYITHHVLIILWMVNQCSLYKYIIQYNYCILIWFGHLSRDLALSELWNSYNWTRYMYLPLVCGFSLWVSWFEFLEDILLADQLIYKSIWLMEQICTLVCRSYLSLFSYPSYNFALPQNRWHIFVTFPLLKEDTLTFATLWVYLHHCVWF